MSEASQIIVSTKQYGPCYNFFRPNGLPILGAWESAPIIAEENRLSFSSEQLISYVPPAGDVILKSITVNEANQLQFWMGHKNDLPALIIPEDFDVAVILMLLGDAPVFPSFTMKALDEDKISEKLWEPQWLSLTDFGRTIYACQQFVEALIFSPESFDVASIDQIFLKSWHQPVMSLMNELIRIKNDLGLNSNSHDVRIIPYGFESLFQHNVQSYKFCLELKDMGMTFDVINKETSEKVDSISSFLNHHREAFPQLIPNFERLRQLCALIQSLFILREKGYCLPENEFREYMKMKEEYEHNFTQGEAETSKFCYRLPLG